MMSQGNIEFKIVHWNCNGIRNKKLEFFDFLLDNHVHIACLNETKLNSKIRFTHNQFNIFRLDNKEGFSKGGVAIVAHRSVECQVLSSLNTETIEAVGIEAKLQSGDTIKIIAAYFTGTTAQHDYRAFQRDIRKLTAHSCIILGDLNAKHNYWNCQRQNQAGRSLYEEMLRHNFEIYFPPHPTFHPGNGKIPATLDIVISTISKPFEPIQNCEDLGSDHGPILLKFLEVPSVRDTQTVRCYSKTDWEKFKRQLNSIINIKDFQFPHDLTTTDIDERIAKLVEALEEATSNCTPTKEVRRQGPALNNEIKQLIQQRRLVKRNLDRTGHPLLRTMYQNVKQLIENLCNTKYNTMFQKQLERFMPNFENNRKVWQMSRVLKGKKNALPFLKQKDSFLMTDAERAEALAEHFHDNHKTTINDRVPRKTLKEVETCITNLQRDAEINLDTSTFVKPKELKSIIRNLPSHKAPGHDNVRNEALKNSSRKFIIAITYVMNACITLSYFPSTWKEALTIPIRKPGKPSSEISSYRPISLLPTLGKVLERILLARINIHLYDSQLIPPTQFGFRPNHSTTHQVLRIIRQIRTGFRHRQSTGMVLLDLKCAFDSVWHDALIYKMSRAHFPTYLIKITQSFLKDRSFKVRVGTTSSTRHKIPAGVPQGAVLSPVLFNIFMSDLPQAVSHTVAQYADDVAFLITNKRAATIKAKLQAAVKQFDKYVSNWRLKLNSTKTEAVFFTRRRAAKAFPKKMLKTGNHEVPWNKCAKYLGVILDQKTTLKQHIDFVLQKCGKCVKMLYPMISRNSKLHQKNKILLYKSCFRPILLYAPSVINLSASTHLHQLQVYQNRLLKMALKKPYNYSTIRLHEEAEIPLVADFIQRLNLIFEAKSRVTDNPLINELFN